MSISSSLSATTAPPLAADNSSANIAKLDGKQDDPQVREQFQQILGELLFGQMLKSMRKTVGQAAYFNGGRAEEIFTEQLDQQIAHNMSQTMADRFVGPMYELTMAGRK